MPRLKSAADLGRLRQEILAKINGKRIISVTDGTDGRTRNSQAVVQAFNDDIRKQGLADKVIVRSTSCHGLCEKEPICVIFPEEICYVSLKPEDVPEIVSTTLIENKLVDRLLYVDGDGKKVVHESEIPFYKHQSRILLGNNRFVDPKRIEDYIAIGGYSALAKALFKMTPEQIINKVKKANLRGRGGAGFPTGIKWETTRNTPRKPKYLIVNADEGDPGAYMDRTLLEGNPHSVLEGLIIGAYAIGSHQGFIYVRQEYPLAVENVNIALEQAREYGLLGRNILGSDFDFDVAVHQGAGAFVSGEESALMSAIEGSVGAPKPKYVYPAVRGLWGMPTNINNVETWANIPQIINRGTKWFTSVGTERSKGTKIFCLVGKVNNTGLVEVPMGMRLGEIIFDIGGGIPDGKKFKAVQTGGPSGGAIPAGLLDTPVDYDELTKLGSIMGSGGMIVIDEDNCMVDIARYFLNFLAEESCGKCLPCREGIYQMLKILNRICQGDGREGDIELLEKIAKVVREFSLCALGGTAPNPTLTTIKYFRDEYEAHIKEKRCPAGVCKALIHYYIQPDKCQACMICLRACPVEAINGGKNLIHVIDQSKCTKCGTCLEVCPPRFSAVTKLSGVKVPESVRPGKEVIRKGAIENE